MCSTVSADDTDELLIRFTEQLQLFIMLSTDAQLTGVQPLYLHRVSSTSSSRVFGGCGGCHLCEVFLAHLHQSPQESVRLQVFEVKGCTAVWTQPLPQAGPPEVPEAFLAEGVTARQIHRVSEEVHTHRTLKLDGQRGSHDFVLNRLSVFFKAALTAEETPPTG